MKIVTTLAKFGAALGLLAMASSAQAVVINVYGNAVDWANGIGDFVVEDFNDVNLQAPLQSISSLNGSIGGGTWNDVITASPGTTFNFNPGVYGIGGDWNLAVPGGPGTGIFVNTVSGSYFVGEIANTTNGFWGFTIDEQVTGVSLSLGSQCCVETYTLENMLIATSVPEPAVLALMGMGLVGIGFARRKRNA